MAFSVDVEHRDEVRVVKVSGELDVSTVPQVNDALEAGASSALVLDLTDVPFMSSAGIALISGARHRADRFAVAGARGDVAMLLEVTGLAAHLTLADDVDAAVAALDEDDEPETPDWLHA